jgi:DNA-binding response OmpR family regulator/tetratricopeptide (TPR) repeat protein
VTDGIVQLEACSVDLVRRTVTPSSGSPRVALTTREADLLRYLSERPSQLVTREAIILEVWGYRDTVVSRACDNTIARLRAKIEADPSRPTHVLTVHGSGYRFEPLVEAPAPGPAPSPPPADRAVLVLGEISVDLKRRWALGPEGEQALSALEVGLIERLLRAEGAIVDRATLLREVWNSQAPSDQSRSVDHAVRRLRAKIEADSSNPRFLLTEWGGGYRLVLPQSRLPAEERDSFVGRAESAEALQIALRTSRWVVVTGVGGMGKTRLVRRVAAGQGPAWWVDLASATTGGEVCQEVARALDVELSGPDSVQQLAYALDRRGAGLLVLDNLEQVADAVAPLIGAWLDGARRLRIVGTSRVRLGLEGESALELEPLPVDEAVALFEQRARAASSTFRVRPSELPLLQRLVTQLDGLPLALELAAARAPTLGLAELLARLDRRLDLLERPRAQAPRHRSLRAALDGSWQLLGEPEAQALVRLALFGAGFDIADVEGLLGEQGVDLVQELRDHGLVHTRLEGRPLGMLESIRAYAAEQRQASPDGGQQAELDWVRWLCRLAGTAPEELPLESSADLLLATRRALRWGEPALAAAAVRASVALHEHRGPYAPTLALVDAVVAAAGHPPEVLLELYHAQGRLLRQLDRPEEALEALARARGLAQEEPLARILADEMASWADLNRNEEAAAAAERAATLFLASGRPDRAAWMRARAVMFGGAGDGAQAYRDLEHTHEQAMLRGDRPLAAGALLQLGRFDLANGRPGLSQSRLAQSAALYRELRRPMQATPALRSRAFGLLLTGEHDELEAIAREGLEQLELAGSAVEAAVLWTYLTASRVLRADEPGWRAASAEARAQMARCRPIPRTLGFLELRESDGHFDRGDLGSALELARSAQARLVSSGDEQALLAAHGAMARCAAAAGDLALAREHGERARAGEVPSFATPVLLAQYGRVALALGRPEEARQVLRQAEQAARAAGVDRPYSEARVEMDRLRRALAEERACSGT